MEIEKLYWLGRLYRDLGDNDLKREVARSIRNIVIGKPKKGNHVSNK